MGTTNLDSLVLSGNLTVTGSTVTAGQTLTDLTTTGNTVLGNAVTDTLTISGATSITSTSANALAVGANGTTNPVLKVVASTASVATGISVTGAAAGSNVAIAAISSGTNEGISIAGKGTGAVTLGQATSTGVILAADQPILDSSSNELIKFIKAASAVNEISIANAVTGDGVYIEASGGDTNISMQITGKGTGLLALGGPTTAELRNVGNAPITDQTGNEFISFTSTASAVNQLNIANAAAAGTVALSVVGGDTNAPIKINAKGSGTITIGDVSTGAISLSRQTNINGGLQATGSAEVAAGEVVPAGGNTIARLVIGSTLGFGVYVGSGAPTVSAAQGSLYLRSDGSSTSTRAYIATNGAGTWTAITTAA